MTALNPCRSAWPSTFLRAAEGQNLGVSGLDEVVQGVHQLAEGSSGGAARECECSRWRRKSAAAGGIGSGQGLFPSAQTQLQHQRHERSRFVGSWGRAIRRTHALEAWAVFHLKNWYRRSSQSSFDSQYLSLFRSWTIYVRALFSSSCWCRACWTRDIQCDVLSDVSKFFLLMWPSYFRNSFDVSVDHGSSIYTVLGHVLN